MTRSALVSAAWSAFLVLAYVVCAACAYPEAFEDVWKLMN